MSVDVDSGLLVDRRNMAFSLDAGIADKAALGLIVLATDNTIEHEWRAMLGGIPGVAFYESRIWNSASITPETLIKMKDDITAAARLIRPGGRIDVMAFACTSGGLVIGDEAVGQRIRAAKEDVFYTTPLMAAVAAFDAMRVRRVALLTPYVERINQMMRDYLVDNGLCVPVMGSFNHDDDNEVARIDLPSLTNAVLELGSHAAVDGVFVSCTSLRLAEHVESLEARLGKPVTSSNHALAWHSLRLAGQEQTLPRLGRLFQTGLAPAARP